MDEGSSEYYSFGNDPARQTKLSTATEEEPSARSVVPPLDASVRAAEEARLDEGEGGEPLVQTAAMAGYSVDDSPPIGPGGRRSRAR